MALHVIVIYQTKISCNSHFVHLYTRSWRSVAQTMSLRSPDSPSTSAELLQVVLGSVFRFCKLYFFNSGLLDDHVACPFLVSSCGGTHLRRPIASLVEGAFCQEGHCLCGSLKIGRRLTAFFACSLFSTCSLFAC